MKLNRCPYCGSKAKIVKHKNMFAIVCTSNLNENCFYYCGFDDKIWFDVINLFAHKKDAINLWNRRAK